MTVEQWNNLKVGDVIFNQAAPALMVPPLTVEDVFTNSKAILSDRGLTQGLTLGYIMANGSHYHTSAFDNEIYSYDA